MSGSFPPHRVSIGRKLLTGFGLVLAMLATIAVVVWMSTREFSRSAQLVTRSGERLEASERLLRHLTEMESERRAFLLSGDDAAARNHALAAQGSGDAWAVLKAGTSGLEKLDALLARNSAVQNSGMEARRSQGPASAPALLAAGAPLLREIRHELEALENHDHDVLLARSVQTERIERRTTLVLWAGTLLTLVALVGAGGTILSDIAARRRAEEVLADQHNLLSSIIDTLPDHIYVKDVRGRFMMDNRAHRHFLELAEGESIEGRTVFDFFPASLANLYDAGDQEVFESGVALRNRDEPATTRSGVEYWLSTTKVPLKEPGGRILGLVCVSADITERKQADEQLKRFAAQLERSNSELQNFASVASHDLQEPLRKIQAFGDRLRVKCGPQLGEAGLDYLGRMQNAAERMRVLIQDLLKLTRVTSRAQPFEKCDLNEVVREVLSDLEVAIESKAARVDVGPLPIIAADPVQMRQLFQNLISNALKFQRAGETPLVTIRNRAAEGAEDFCQIAVEDNGIGFGSQFAEQIFVVFQRLHSRTEYEGTGIGLAVCRKITDRHGGTILAESKEGQGATFVVSLPLRQPAQPDP